MIAVRGAWYAARRMVPRPDDSPFTEATSDAELAAGVERRHPGAERELCRRFAPRIRVYGVKHLRSEEHARDLVQAVLLAVLVALREGRVIEIEELGRFVLGTCRHLVHHQRRASSRAEPLPPELVLEAPSLDDERVDQAALFRCLEGLDLRSRTILQLAFCRDKSAQEIADLLATTAGNVRVVRHRALGALRQCLDGKAQATP